MWGLGVLGWWEGGYKGNFERGMRAVEGMSYEWIDTKVGPALPWCVMTSHHPYTGKISMGR